MAYTNRAMLAMIASALNPLIPAVQKHSDHIPWHSDLAELVEAPDRNGLIFMMADGTQFKITSEEVI